MTDILVFFGDGIEFSLHDFELVVNVVQLDKELIEVSFPEFFQCAINQWLSMDFQFISSGPARFVRRV